MHPTKVNSYSGSDVCFVQDYNTICSTVPAINSRQFCLSCVAFTSSQCVIWFLSDLEICVHLAYRTFLLVDFEYVEIRFWPCKVQPKEGKTATDAVGGFIARLSNDTGSNQKGMAGRRKGSKWRSSAHQIHHDKHFVYKLFQHATELQAMVHKGWQSPCGSYTIRNTYNVVCLMISPTCSQVLITRTLYWRLGWQFSGILCLSA